MLVLSRKPGESIAIGPDIEIHCVEVRGDVVRLGIVAPRSVKIWRKELLEAVERENASAAKAPPLEGLEKLFPLRETPEGKDR